MDHEGLSLMKSLTSFKLQVNLPHLTFCTRKLKQEGARLPGVGEPGKGELKLNGRRAPAGSTEPVKNT
jgi:hypothetical protein